jgi:hypothetical protein
MANKHLIHAHSSVITEGQPKLPSVDRIEYGELAVNFAKGKETISLKNSDDEIVTFSSDVTIKSIIRKNEKVIANALVDLDDRLKFANNDLELLSDNLDEKVGSIKYTTAASLKSLRDSSLLLPGQWYRITDYVATTTQTGTSSANHPFDILVMASATDALNENAKAIMHNGDIYFENANLDAWELKYSIDNDTTKYAWADSTNGNGVIYYMKDEWGNECPYDFKGIVFDRVKPGDTNPTSLYTFNATDTVANNENDLTVTQYALEQSINGTNGDVCTNNVIKSCYMSISASTYIADNAMVLPNVVFMNEHHYTDDSDYAFAKCNGNVINENCYMNTFANSCSDNTVGKECTNINVKKSNVRWTDIESGNKYIDLTSTQTTSDSNWIQNITVAKGTNTTTTVKTISHDTLNNAFKTTYQNSNSAIVNV